MVVTPDEAISDDSAKEDSPDKGTHLSFFFQFSEITSRFRYSGDMYDINIELKTSKLSKPL